MKKAVILLSGGMDSATILAIARRDGFECYALSFSYGQRHEIELIAANKIAKASAVKEHKTIEIDLGAFGGSALTADIPVPKGRPEIGGEIPITYVPARNTVFLSFALAYLDVIGADAIFIGVNALDYSGYPDCRPEYIEAFEKMANLATKRGVEGKHPIKIETPLLHMTKAGIIKAGAALNVDYGMTISCYDPDKKGRACGACDACILRKKGFEEAGVKDPTKYQ
jgi:7-cyano-7-deazaguanine synthase